VLADCCQVVRCEGGHLVAYKSQLTAVLTLTLHVVCKDVLTLSCTMLKHLLKALTSIYANDYRSTTNDWDLPLDQVLPIRVCHTLLSSFLYLLLNYYYNNDFSFFVFNPWDLYYPG